MTAYPETRGASPGRIGLMGGTLNPIHIAHLVIAETARETFNLDRVIWIPAGDPPHKTDEDLAPQDDRYEMARLATDSNPAFEVSRMELDREGPSYTLLTLQHFHRQIGPEDLYFIAGADTVLELLTWYRHDEVIKLCRFIAAARPGYNLDRMKAVLPPDYIRRIDVMEVPQVDVSSTEIRERVREGRSIRYLTPDPVADYIRERGLYR